MFSPTIFIINIYLNYLNIYILTLLRIIKRCLLIYIQYIKNYSKRLKINLCNLQKDKKVPLVGKRSKNIYNAVIELDYCFFIILVKVLKTNKSCQK